MTKPKNEGTKKMLIKLPPELHEFLSELAKRNHRSMQQQVVALIDNAKFISENY
jgi:hypothetical protein